MIKNTVGFLRNKTNKNCFFDQKLAAIDFKVCFCWNFMKISRFFLDLVEIHKLPNTVMIQKRRFFNVFNQQIGNPTCRSYLNVCKSIKLFQYNRISPAELIDSKHFTWYVFCSVNCFDIVQKNGL